MLLKSRAGQGRSKCGRRVKLNKWSGETSQRTGYSWAETRQGEKVGHVDIWERTFQAEQEPICTEVCLSLKGQQGSLRECRSKEEGGKDARDNGIRGRHLYRVIGRLWLLPWEKSEAIEGFRPMSGNIWMTFHLWFCLFSGEEIAQSKGESRRPTIGLCNKSPQRQQWLPPGQQQEVLSSVWDLGIFWS